MVSHVAVAIVGYFVGAYRTQIWADIKKPFVKEVKTVAADIEKKA